MTWKKDTGRLIHHIRRDVEDWKRARTVTRRQRNREQLRKWAIQSKRLLDNVPRTGAAGQAPYLWAHHHVAARLTIGPHRMRIDRAHRSLFDPAAFSALVARYPQRATPVARPTVVAVKPGLIATLVEKVKEKMPIGTKRSATVLSLNKPTAEDEAAFRRMVALTAEVKRTGNEAKARTLFGVAQHLLHVMESGKYRRMGAGLQTAIRRAIDEGIRVANRALSPAAGMRFDGKRAAQQFKPIPVQQFKPAPAQLVPTIAQFQALAREIATLTGQVRSSGNQELARSLQEKINRLENWALRPHIKQALLRLPAKVQQAILAGLRIAKQVAAQALAPVFDEPAPSYDEDEYWKPSSSGSGDGGGYFSDDDSDLFDDEDDEDDEDDYADDESSWTSEGDGDGAYWSTDDDELEEIDVDDLEFLETGDQLVDEIDGDEVITDGDAAELIDALTPGPVPEPGIVDRVTSSVRAHPLMWGAGAVGAAFLGHRYWQSRQGQ
jgi:hypothetical protein